ncbi:MAG TPA: hypothetical protein VGL89_00675 [Candidatus Koribacter sp.]|jgi:hypothetical protein
MREIKLGASNKLVGSADFTVVLQPPAAASAQLISGDPSFSAVTDRLAKAKFPLFFPEGSKAKLSLRLLVSCHESEGCNAVVMPPIPKILGATF